MNKYDKFYLNLDKKKINYNNDENYINHSVKDATFELRN